ncbi:unnamed protein product [Bemisia tabaci]|uniref:Uncharacterized protein n=1 Tax=Bemisia tabaci TaxID=7038 RepID=A0A9P0AC85_BEMTA|nr:unnamed protein product [Bemisia tabaci]
MSSSTTRHLPLLFISKSVSKSLLSNSSNFGRQHKSPNIFMTAASRYDRTFSTCRRPLQSYSPDKLPETTVRSKRIPIPTFRKAEAYLDNIALQDHHGDYSYRGLFESSASFSKILMNELGGKMQERVAFLCPNSASYIITQWACSMSGQIAVPLCPSHPPTMLEYFVTDSDAKVLVTTKEFLNVLEDLAKKTGRKLLLFDESLSDAAMVKQEKKLSSSAEKTEQDSKSDAQDTNVKPLVDGGLEPELYSCLDALIIYTSGSTGSPKGVVYNYTNLEAQISSLVKAWAWTNKDAILHTLPLHHIHGVVNALACPLHVGARCVMRPNFDPAEVWHYLLALKQTPEERVNIFMGVPTMYVKLIEEYDKALSKTEKMVEYVKSHCEKNIRLMVSGSAPLPSPIFSQWEKITGHRLLERYGMTETGMVLSNPLNGDRIPGSVGQPLPGVAVRIVSEENEKPGSVIMEATESTCNILSKTEEIKGTLEVKGDAVFQQYWRKPEATKREFTQDGWFKTGDVACYEDNTFKLLGRKSVDVIKTGGYKVSALNVETALLAHPDIVDVSVVGLPDTTWGQKIAALIVVKSGQEITLPNLRTWAKERIPPYAVPTVMKVMEKIPRNAMGKTNKKQIVQELFPEHKGN